MTYESLNYGQQREDFQGSFLGFTFNERHSSEFGITRVSVSNRYEDKLLPNMKDKVVEVPGGDGKYYFGSQYADKQWQISIAFDSVSEEQLEDMKIWLGDRGVHELKFDESDYKAYYAKCTGSPSLKYLCFETDDGDVYKGEGTFNFTAFYPFAHSEEIFQVNFNRGDFPEMQQVGTRMVYAPNISKILSLNDEIEVELDNNFIAYNANKGDTNQWYGNSMVSKFTFNPTNKTYKIKRGISETNERSILPSVSSPAWTIIGINDELGYIEAFKNSEAYQYFIPFLKIDVSNVGGEIIREYSYFSNPKTINQPSDWVLDLYTYAEDLPIKVSYVLDDTELAHFVFTPTNNQEIISINSKTELLSYGGEISNNWISEGDFFKISSLVNKQAGKFKVVQIDGQTETELVDFQVRFQYLYY